MNPRVSSSIALSPLVSLGMYLGFFLGVFLLGCSGNPPDLPGAAASDSDKCEVGQSKRCAMELGTDGSSVSCAPGVQQCEGGHWGVCIPDPTLGIYMVPAPAPKPSGLGVLSLASSATDCRDNPCDPYCRALADVPDSAVTSTPTITVTSSTGGDLASSNAPPAFKTKGSLNDRCTTPCTTKSCQEACQFDQKCGTTSAGTPGCVPFGKTESGSCTGADITAPTTCVPSTGYRNVTVCNRGTLAVSPGVKCFVFPGGSPKYPEDAPSMKSAKLVLTTATTLKPGVCETQTLAESTFPNGGIESLMCNPPGSSSGGLVVETSAGTKYPTASTTTGWATPEGAYASGGTYASWASVAVTTPNAYPTTWTSGWANPANVQAEDATNATAALPTSGGGVGMYPTGNSTTSWSNATYAYAAGESDATKRYASNTPAMPAQVSGVTTAHYPSSNTGNTCNNGTACKWQNPTYAYAAESPPAASPSYATAALSQSSSVDSTSIFFGGFFTSSDIPSNATITGITLAVSWKGNEKNSVSAQLFKADGATAIGTAISRTANCNANSYSETRTSTYTVSGLTIADLISANLVKLTATHCGNSSSDTTYVDSMTVTVSYQAAGADTTNTLTLNTFGLAVPSGATINSVSTEVKWKVSAANSSVTLGLQPFTGTTDLGSELTTTATSALTTDTVSTQTLPASAISTLSATPGALGAFGVRVRATRSGTGSPNPDITAYVDYVKVTANYSIGVSSVSSTFGNFGLSVPAGATILGVTTEGKWAVTAANPTVVLGLQPLLGGSNWGSELTTTSGSSPPTALTLASRTAATNATGGALSSTDLANGNFGVTVRATRNGGTGDVDTTGLLDALRARATYVTTPTSTVDYSGFGFDVPTARDLMRVTAAVKWRVDTSNTNVTLGFQAYKDGGLTPVGSETTTTVGSSPPTTDSVVSTDLDISALTPADVNSSSFLVRVRATRGATSATNSDFTAFLDYVSLTATYATTTGGNLSECNPYNNWSATKLNPDPEPCVDQTTVAYPKWTMTRVFQAECPVDKGSSWSFFIYDSITPGNSKINFRFRTFRPTNGTCVALPAVTTSPPAPLAVAQASPNTQVCGLGGGVPGCPVDLYAGLGVPAVFAPCLQMDARGIPDSGDTGSPTLKSWAVRFDCVDNQ